MRPKTAPKGPYEKPPQVVPGHDIQVFTQWQTWSPCNKCGEVGKKVRFGICNVKLLHDGDLKTNTVNIPKRIKPSSEKLTNQAAGVIETEERKAVKILTLFKGGIPCRSSLLPPELQSIPEILTRKSEVMVAFCKVSVCHIMRSLAT